MKSSFESDAQTVEPKKRVTVALAGNPNAGKTTLFNALTGLRQKVANYPGVTVERKEGVWRVSRETAARLVDLPGLYSLRAASLDEQIARDALTGKIKGLDAPDVIVAAVDATNIERNLYLLTQLLEYGTPTVVALTMTDEAERAGVEVDAVKLSESLKVPVVPVVARRRRGLEELAGVVERAARGGRKVHDYPFVEGGGKAGNGGGDSDAADTSAVIRRYAWIERAVGDAVSRKEESGGRKLSEKIDGVLTHKIFGLPILVLTLLVLFQAIFSWATLPMDLLDRAFGALGEAARGGLPPGLLADLVVDGVIAGVGGVLVFLPQIVLLFLFISLLEDTGYMARAAFLLDRVMRGVGLHGKAFLPLMSSFACAIPGVMATRTIENPKDRLATIMIAPLMSCSARLPVYTLMIGAFFSGRYVFGFLAVGALLMVAMYALGVVVAVVVALILKRTLLKAPAPPLIIELPPYRLPNPKTLLLNVSQRAGMFVKRAGTVIFALSILLWGLMNFPRPAADAQGRPAAAVVANSTAAPPAEPARPGEAAGGMSEEARAAEAAERGEILRYSIAGRIGRAVEPVIAPLGYDWKIGIGLISSFAARETFVSTMSILYNVGQDEGAESESLLQAVRDARREDGSPVWSPLLALSTMLFYLLAFQCMATFSVVRRETGSWGWTFLMVGYMTALAYAAAFLTYQGGRLLGF